MPFCRYVQQGGGSAPSWKRLLLKRNFSGAEIRDTKSGSIPATVPGWETVLAMTMENTGAAGWEGEKVRGQGLSSGRKGTRKGGSAADPCIRHHQLSINHDPQVRDQINTEAILSAVHYWRFWKCHGSSGTLNIHKSTTALLQQQGK